MSFINVNKVTLDGGNGDIRKDMADVMLLTASLAYDAIMSDRFEDAITQIGLLKSALKSVKFTIDDDKESFYKEDLGKIEKAKVTLIETDIKGKVKETTFDNFILYVKTKGSNDIAVNAVNVSDFLLAANMLQIRATKHLSKAETI